METHKSHSLQETDKYKFLQLVLMRCLEHETFNFHTVSTDDNFHLILEDSETVAEIHFHILPEPRQLHEDDLNEGGDFYINKEAETNYFIFTNCLTDQLKCKKPPTHKFNFLNFVNLCIVENDVTLFIDRLPSCFNLIEALERLASHCRISRYSSQLILDRLYSYIKFTRTFTRSDLRHALLDLFLCKYKVDLFYDTRSQCNKFWHDITIDNLLTVVKSDFLTDSFLKSHTVGLITEHGDSSELAYRNLWLRGKVSLLTSASSSDDFDNIVSILKAFSSNLVRVTISTVSDHEESVFDLTNDEARRLLDCKINLQGKLAMELRQFVDESMVKSLKSGDFIRLVSDNFIVDYCYKKLPQYFIDRRYLRSIFEYDVVSRLREEVFVIQNKADGLNLPLQTLENSQLSNLRIVVDGVSETVEEARKSKQPVHLFVSYGDSWLEWKASWGSVDNLRKFDISQEMRLASDVSDLMHVDVSKVHVLAMETSSGKSTLLDYLALSIPDKWTLHVDLNRFLSDYEPNSALGHLRRFRKQDKSLLTQQLFEQFVNLRKVLVLLDNYDQAVLNHCNEAIEVIASLHEANFDLWIVASSKNVSLLENRLGTITLSIQPFTLQNQHDFLTKYFNQFGTRGDDVTEFVKTLLGLLRTEIDGFFDSPLYLTFIANLYVEELKHYFMTGGLRLKENFVSIKFLDALSVSYINYLSDKYDLSDNKFFSHRLSILALRSVFEQNDLKDFDGLKDDVVREFTIEGIVESELPYPILAHFLIAKWMFENLANRRSWVRALNRRRFCNPDRYRDTFKMFDLMLARNLPLHTALILGKMKYMPVTNNTDFNLTDMGGRNMVHLAALYGVVHPVINIIRGLQLDDKLVNVVMLSDMETIEANDTLLGYSTLDYALSTGCLAIANVICEKLPRLISCVNIGLSQLESYIQYCNQIDSYMHLYKTLLKYIICNKIATTQLRENQSAGGFSTFLPYDEVTCQTIDNYITGFEATTLSHLMEKLELKKANARYFNNLHLAAAFGSEKNILSLLKEGSKINNLGNRSCTPLHTAVIYNRGDNVDTLLAARAKINIVDPFGNTALHLACSKHNPQLVAKLIKKGTDISIRNDEGDTPFHHALKHSCEQSAELFLPDRYYSLFFSPQTSISRDRCLDVNMRNNSGDTPLLLALKHNCRGIVRELLEYQADVTVVNKSGNTCLHYAADIDDYKTALELIYNRVNVNVVNDEGHTPLLMAMNNLHIRIARLLLSKGAHVHGTMNAGSTCLHFSVHSGFVDMINTMLDRGVEIDREDDFGGTALRLAVLYQHLDVVVLLLKRGADPNISDSEGCSTLHHAVCFKQATAIEVLIEYGCTIIDKKNNDGEAPLTAAIRIQEMFIAKLLLRKGADATIVDARGSSCLHHAIFSFALMDDLLKMGLDVNREDNDGNTPLLVAAEERRIPVVKLLIASGADIFAENKAGYSLIHYASRYGVNDIILDLLNKGADVNKKTGDGNTPLSLHIRDWHLEWSTVNLLIAQGADVNIIDNETGNSILHLATEKGQAKVIRALLGTAVGVNLKNNEGDTALHLAIKGDHYEIAQLLLAKGADPNIGDNVGSTCLHSAIRAENDRMVMTLLKHGVNASLANKSGETPMSQALRLGYGSIVSLLLTKVPAESNSAGLFSAVAKGEVHTVKKLIDDNSIDINMRDEDGNTPLLLALANCRVGVIDYLLSKEVDVTVSNNNGFTGLHYAVELGDVRIMRQLLQGGCEIDALTINDDSALLHAIVSDYFHMAQLLLDHNAQSDIIPLTNYKGPCLHAACRSGADAIVSRILQSGFNIDTFDTNGTTALIHAVSKQHRQIALTLIESGADITIVDDSLDSCLSLAIIHQYCDMIKLLLDKGLQIDCLDEGSSTLLRDAIMNEKREVVKLLLSRGANVHLGETWPGYPLHAAVTNEMTDVAVTILDQGFDINKSTISDGTAVYAAASKKNYSATMMLINRGASLDVFSDNFSTILTYAAQNGWEDLTRERIRNGDNIHHRNNNGSTPLHLAIDESQVNVAKLLFKEILAQDCNDSQNNYLHCASEFGDNKIVSALLDKGYNINKQTYTGETPLLRALKSEKLSTAKLLLTEGADYNMIEYDEGNSCLHYFAQYAWDDMVSKMLREGFNVDIKTNGGSTPLHMATQSQNLSTIKLLLAHGADSLYPNNYDDTPFDYCIRNACVQTLEVFLDKVDQKHIQSAAFEAVDLSHLELLDTFIKVGVDNFENSCGDTTLSLAVKNGHHSFVRHLLDRGCNIDSVTSSGDSLLLLAVKSGNLDMVRLLLDGGADVNITDSGGDSCLHHAVCGSEEMVTLFLDRGNLDLKNFEGLTPLLYALKGSYTDSAQLLISVGADIQVEDFIGSNCLHYAVKAGSEEIVRQLVDNGLDIHKRNVEGDDCLDVAVHNGCVGVMKLLVSYGANLHQANRFGESCLMKAIESNDDYVLDILEKEININEQCNKGHTPFTMALETSNTAYAKMLLSKNSNVHLRNRSGSNLHYAISQGVDIIAELLDLGLDPDEQDDQGNTPLLIAIKSEAVDTVKRLLERGANVHIRNNEYNSCLHCAVEQSNLELFSLLISTDTNLNCWNRLGETPLLRALKTEKLEYAHMLLSQGADCTVSDNENGSCLFYASRFGFTDLVSTFISRGADVNQTHSNGSPLQAALEGKHTATVKYLIENGADIHSCISSVTTWIDYVIPLNDIEIMETLIDKGIDLNCRLTRSDPLLITAFKERSRTMVDFLIAKGADIHITSFSTGDSCLHYAARAGYDDIVNDLLNKGLDIDRENNQRETPLRLAFIESNVSTIKLLLTRGASVDDGNFQTTYLHHATNMGDNSLVLELIDRGTDLNVRNGDGDTPLILAVSSNNVDIVKLLLEKGSDYNLRNKLDRNLLHIAKSVGADDLVTEFVNLSLNDEELE